LQTKLLIEQHFHGAFGIDFNTATVDDVLFLAKEIKKYGIGGIFPTIVTDNIENTRRAINTIKKASETQTDDMAKIFGVHLEGIFLNPEKKGIHNPEWFLQPTVENYKLIEDDFIKILTLAPEFATTDLMNYLSNKNIKIQAGHCTGGNLTGCNGVTHLFNAMSGISHRANSTALSALINDEIYAEIIADGVHVFDDALKLLFKTKPIDKIILISDCLPCTKSNITEFSFAGEKVFYDGEKATSKEGTLAGSTTLLPDIIKRLSTNLPTKALQTLITNPYNYHAIDVKGSVEWDENWNIVQITTN
jgi:N-acetylglucosamine-6-phosphate deacetylase